MRSKRPKVASRVQKTWMYRLFSFLYIGSQLIRVIPLEFIVCIF